MLKVRYKDDKIPRITQFDTILSDFVAINKNKFKNAKNDNESLSSLIDIPLCQSKKIQFGNRMENMISAFISINTQFVNIKEKNRKGKRETDHLFMDTINNIIYYAELKSNLNLDTEKSIETVKKCLEIKKTLTYKYPECKIRMYLVSLRHLMSQTIRKDIKNKYYKISNNLLDINEYLTKLGIPQQKEFANEKNYKIFINKFVGMLKPRS